MALYLCFQIGNAQEEAQKHVVRGEETLMDIAEQYNVTIENIQVLNPNIVDGIKENDVLLIPKKQDLVISKPPVRYTVQAGDTKYSLSNKFGVSISDLEEQNPQIVNMLQVGQVLQIEGAVTDYEEISVPLTYVVQKGDTKFSLSKKFGISIQQLEKSNPQIVPILQLGQILRVKSVSVMLKEESSTGPIAETDKPVKEEIEIIPKIEVQENIRVGPTSEKSYVPYEIQPSETLFGLSKKAGMTMEAFVALNPKLASSVQAGMTIKMPSGVISTTNATTAAYPQTRYDDLSQTMTKNKKSKLLFFLPLSQTDFNSENTGTDNPNDFTQENKEFFRGAKIAIDSAKTLGLNFDINIVNTKTARTQSELLTIARNSNMGSFDAVILPYYEKSAQDIAALVAKDQIPVITSSVSTSKETSPNLYLAVPSVNSERKAMLDYLTLKQGNIIAISDISRTESKAFIAGNASKSRFLEMNENGTFDSDDLIGMLQKDKINYVILDSDRNGVFLSATTALLRELANYQIQLVLLESSLIPDDASVSRKRFVILKTLYPSSIPVASSFKTKRFNEEYKKQFNSDPPPISLMGFDITFDTLLRLSQEEGFENSAIDDITEYNSLKFEYKKNNAGYYSNQGIYILQYETDRILKEVN